MIILEYNRTKDNLYDNYINCWCKWNFIILIKLLIKKLPYNIKKYFILIFVQLIYILIKFVLKYF